jgi:hypothetical protein
MPDPETVPRKPPFIVAEEDEPEETPEPARAAAEAEPEETDDETRFPAWAKVPEGLKFPAGVSIWFVPLQVRLMRKKTGGDAIVLKDGTTRVCRQVIFWELNLEDQRRAFQRAGGDANRAADELTLQMIRAVDGSPVDWTSESSPHHPRRIWSDMGPKIRNLMHRLYTATHVLGDAEVQDFFVNCVDVKKTI